MHPPAFATPQDARERPRGLPDVLSRGGVRRLTPIGARAQTKRETPVVEAGAERLKDICLYFRQRCQFLVWFEHGDEPLEPVGVFRRLVPAQSIDPRKAHGNPRLVPIRAL